MHGYQKAKGALKCQGVLEPRHNIQVCPSEARYPKKKFIKIYINMNNISEYTNSIR